MTQFSDLGLNEKLLKAVTEEGYTTPTPIQAQAIRPVMEGRDLLGIAQTGTGKTAAFALPILHRLAEARKPPMRRGARCLVLAPTRELATQIAESFKTYGRHLGFSVVTVFGGVGHRPQANALRNGVDVVVATPGRLLDHIGEGNVDLSSTEVLVLDEADQMMDLGFIRPLRQIISRLSQRRQSLFFSATMPQEIGALAAEMLREPTRVSVTPVAKTADRVAQKVIYIEQKKKKSLLVELFGDESIARAIIFTRTKRGADRVARHLDAAGIKVAAIHGNKSQGQREQALGAFKGNKLRALVATDIAARGIDVDEVTHVINFEIPNIPESYVHRIGRTARAGAEGIAISLVDNEERVYLRDIEKLTKQQIPFTDRRNDTSLAVEERAPRGEDDGERRHAGGGRGFGRGGQQGERGHGRGHGQHSAGRGQGARGSGERGQGERGHDARGRGGHGQGAGGRGEGRDHRGAAGAERGAARRGGEHARHEGARDAGRNGGRRHEGGRPDGVWSNDGGFDRDFRASRNPSPSELGGEGRPSEHRSERSHGEGRPHGGRLHGARPHGARSQGDREARSFGDRGRDQSGRGERGHGNGHGHSERHGERQFAGRGGDERRQRPSHGKPSHGGGERREQQNGERRSHRQGSPAGHPRGEHRAARPGGGERRPQRDPRG